MKATHTQVMSLGVYEMRVYEPYCSANRCGEKLLTLPWRAIISGLVGLLFVLLYAFSVSAGLKASNASGVPVSQSVTQEILHSGWYLAITIVVILLSMLINSFQKQDAISCLLGGLGLPGTILGIIWAIRFSIGG